MVQLLNFAHSYRIHFHGCDLTFQTAFNWYILTIFQTFGTILQSTYQRRKKKHEAAAAANFVRKRITTFGFSLMSSFLVRLHPILSLSLISTKMLRASQRGHCAVFQSIYRGSVHCTTIASLLGFINTFIGEKMGLLWLTKKSVKDFIAWTFKKTGRGFFC